MPSAAPDWTRVLTGGFIGSGSEFDRGSPARRDSSKMMDDLGVCYMRVSVFVYLCVCECACVCM